MTINRPAEGWQPTRPPTSPGEMLLNEFLAPFHLSQHALAMKIGVPATRIADIVHDRRGVSPDTALRLARFFGNSPQFWLNLQQARDLYAAQTQTAERIEREVQVFRQTGSTNSPDHGVNR